MGRRGVEEYVELDIIKNRLRIFDRSSGTWAEVKRPWE